MNLPKMTMLGALVLCGAAWAGDESPKHQVPESADGNLVVGLCDGQTSVEVKGVKKGETLSRKQAQAVSDELMREWKRKNPNAQWDEETVVAQRGNPPRDVSPKQPAPPPSGSKAAPVTGGPSAEQGAKAAARQSNVQAQTYGAFSDRDEKIWRASTQKVVDEGDKIFHDAKALGGTIGVSCDMCHPNAANTHPETYPKYQVQLGRVALLRDMINWCIENPVRGKPLADDDPKMKALESFIYAERKGVPLEYGKH